MPSYRQVECLQHHDCRYTVQTREVTDDRGLYLPSIKDPELYCPYSFLIICSHSYQKDQVTQLLLIPAYYASKWVSVSLYTLQTEGYIIIRLMDRRWQVLNSNLFWLCT